MSFPIHDYAEYFFVADIHVKCLFLYTVFDTSVCVLFFGFYRE